MDGFNPDQVTVRNAHFIGGHHVEGGAGTTWSPIISTQEMERIDGIVQRAVAGGGQLATGARRVSIGTDSALYQPTILTNVDGRMEAVKTEIFEPVMTVMAEVSGCQAYEANLRFKSVLVYFSREA